MKKQVFEGVATALITPLNEKGVDFDSLVKLINWQIESGIDALVICGSTGEKATLNDEEHVNVLRCAVETAAGRVPIIAGTGSNDTAHAVWMTREACDLGCDAMLVSTPYYNKSTQKGLVKMFNTIADASDKPIIVYNVPSRTGIAIEPETYLAISDHPMICGVKEAGDNFSKNVEMMRLVGDKLAVYSGNDNMVVPLMSLGGKGVISVLSNLLPKETVQMTKLALAGDFAAAAKMQLQYLPLINALFSEVNPIPVKAAMAALGFCENYVRLPLVPMEKEHEAVLLQCMRDAGLKV